METKQFDVTFLVHIFTIYKIARNVPNFQQRKDKYRSILDPKKKKKLRFYKKGIIRYQLNQLFLRQLICIELNICNFALITDVQVSYSFSDEQVYNGSIEDRKEERKSRIISLTCAPTNLYESRVSRFTRCVTSSIVF